MARVSLTGGWVLSAVLVAALLLIPLIPNHLILSMAIVIGLHGIIAVGQNLLMGYAGQVSLGQAAFYGIGAYASGVLTTKLGVSPWLAMFVGVLLAAAVAYVVGLPTFRLEGLYLSLATLGFGVIVYIVLVEWIPWTGGPSGITAIPYLNLFDFEFKNDKRFYYLVLAAAIPAVLAARSLVQSRIGRALRAIHGSEAAAAALGINVGRLKLYTFVVSAVYASVAGSLYAHWVTFISPVPFDFMESIRLVMISIVGGAATIAGAFVGAAVMTVLQEALRDLLPILIPGAGGEVEILFFGLLLVAIMIWMPDGVTAAVMRLWARLARRGGRARGGSRAGGDAAGSGPANDGTATPPPMVAAREGVAKRGAARG